ncbi:hypothetical protein BIFCAT_00190 [Bifidobacterium catenulatum DSM 16992 = JCM 1194 = LMG 11043]|uniref:Uncharacterized protein n=1 Tax=Bifidobacterium catenulatum DSM 16992 = JCM 1194 = LMG 11043 TaxID=566552 RepID=B6XSN6_9BIFI|nr:hypothetical protein BIFCAT_00190 [Bifidobacterium catenulatum DSM 16992 = JCM 1194 = LMG 11043]
MRDCSFIFGWARSCVLAFLRLHNTQSHYYTEIGGTMLPAVHF